VSIKAPDKTEAEHILFAELAKGLDALPSGTRVMLKLTIPDVTDLYAPFTTDKRVERVVALSGGYTRHDACEKLARQHGMIASFSRALIEDLKFQMSDAEFDAVLGSTDEIYTASTIKD
jgi:fructose-bisphosphate aldolase class I